MCDIRQRMAVDSEEIDDPLYDESSESVDIDAVCELIEEAEFDADTDELFVWTREINGILRPTRARTLDELRDLLIQLGWERDRTPLPSEREQGRSLAPVPSLFGDILIIGGERPLSGPVIEEAIERTNVRRLFERSPSMPPILYQLKPDLIVPPVAIEFCEINEALIRYLAKHPAELHRLHPRKFEELVAALFRDFGYEVLLTPRAKDGGFDVRAIRKDGVGCLLYLIECKRYCPDRSVSVDLVRALYGVTKAEGATVGVLATTSRFTRDAREFARKVQYQLSLRDFDDIRAWLQHYSRH